MRGESEDGVVVRRICGIDVDNLLLNSIQKLPKASSRSLEVWVIGARIWPLNIVFVKTFT